MEEKVTALAPPVILSPKEGDKVETLELEGTGVVGNAIYINWSVWAESKWERAADVGQNQRWQHRVSTELQSFAFPGPIWFRVRHEHWSGEVSEPSPTITVTKLLSPPVIKTPLAGESLPQREQMIEGTGFYLASVLEIELSTVLPLPPKTYETDTSTDKGGWWKATPDWLLEPGRYLLKCRQGYNEHVSRWSDVITVTVE